MNLDQADMVIAELNVCFPSKKLIVEEVKRWEQNLLVYHYEDAVKAVKIIEDTSKFWPSWAEFREAITPMHKERLWIEKERREREQRALMPARTPEEDVRIAEIIKQIKENLGKRV